jgi:hypothetical protein
MDRRTCFESLPIDLWKKSLPTMPVSLNSLIVSHLNSICFCTRKYQVVHTYSKLFLYDHAYS